MACRQIAWMNDLNEYSWNEACSYSMSTKLLLYGMKLTSELSTIQCTQCCGLLCIVITSGTDRDGEIQRESMKAIPFSWRSLAPLCLHCCQSASKYGSIPTPLEPCRATHNQQALNITRLKSVCLSGTVTTHFFSFYILNKGSDESPSIVVKLHHRFQMGAM